MTDRPRLRPWLRPVTRGRGEVQFGVGPGGVILDGLSATEVELLMGLDGSLTRRATFERAARARVPAGRWRELLDLVDRLGLLETPAEARPARPLPGHVLVDGSGELATECALVLRRGIDRVSQGRTATDVAFAAPHLDRPDLVVIVADQAIDPRRGDVWLRHRIPHLPVVAVDTRAEVGPLLDVSPATPCLWCLDLHRTDRDEQWPTLIAQLCRPGELALTGPPALTPPSPGLTHLVAGVTALYAVGLLSGEPPPVGVSAEASLPWPRMDHRRWSRHPRCERHVASRSVVA